MNRRSLLKSFLAVPIVAAVGKAVEKVNPFKLRVKRKPSTVCIDDDHFPEAHLDLNTGDLYMKTDLEHLTDYYDCFHGEILTKESLEMSTFWMNAKRDGECAECESEISIGDRIVYDSDEYKTYCSPCGEEVAGQDPASRSYIK